MSVLEGVVQATSRGVGDSLPLFSASPEKDLGTALALDDLRGRVR